MKELAAEFVLMKELADEKVDGRACYAHGSGRIIHGGKLLEKKIEEVSSPKPY
jgi:hypothetical protein